MIKYLTNPNNIESNAINIVNNLATDRNINEIFVFPDVHISTLESIPVGVCFTSNVDKFYPLVSGKDIGCGVAFCRIPEKYIQNNIVKSSFYNHFSKVVHSFTDEGLGGGNHFLSIEKDSVENYYIVCHTGTRNNGISFYQRSLSLLEDFRIISGINDINYIDVDYLNEPSDDKKSLLSDGNFFKEYNNLLEYSKNRRIKFIDKTLNYLFKANILLGSALENVEIYDSIHNYIEFKKDCNIHRKGVTGFNSTNSIVACPMSMTRGTIYVTQNYSDAQNSCAHGAGRKFSRNDALNYWNSSLKKKERLEYYKNFPEYLTNGEFTKDIITEFDFCYKNDEEWLTSQPHIRKVWKSEPILTVKIIS